MIPRLHLVTDDAVLQSAHFIRTATELVHDLQRDVALHIRARSFSAAELFSIVSELLPVTRTAEARLIVNDRVDVAITTDADGVQLGVRALPIGRARALMKADRLIGCSAHHAAEARDAGAAGADFVFAGSIYQTASHPDQRPGGIALLSECVRVAQVPVLAIGGVTAERIPEILQSEAHGVAVIRAVWHAADPVQAARHFARLLEQ